MANKSCNYNWWATRILQRTDEIGEEKCDEKVSGKKDVKDNENSEFFQWNCVAKIWNWN